MALQTEVCGSDSVGQPPPDGAAPLGRLLLTVVVWRDGDGPDAEYVLSVEALPFTLADHDQCLVAVETARQALVAAGCALHGVVGDPGRLVLG